MKKYLIGLTAILLAVSFATFSSFSHKQKPSREITVRFLQNGSWSTSDEILSDAKQSSGCPEGAGTICAEFYNVSHLNLNANPITVKTDPVTMQPYEPDEVLRYNQ